MTRRWDLDGQVALVTGALGNLGPTWTRALLDAGARVIGLDLPEAKAGDAFAALEHEFGDTLAVVRADVTDRPSLERARTWCVSRMGRVTILVNNAGIDQPPITTGSTFRAEDMPLDYARRIFEVNVLGALAAIQVFGAAMVEAGRGAIVNIGSLYATVSPDQRFYDHIPADPPFLKYPPYGASKAALVNLTRYFATLWGPHGVRVNALSPGGVQAGQDGDFQHKYSARVPLGRMAERDDLAGPLVFLASDAARYVTGINLQVDGGFTAW